MEGHRFYALPVEELPIVLSHGPLSAEKRADQCEFRVENISPSEPAAGKLQTRADVLPAQPVPQVAALFNAGDTVTAQCRTRILVYFHTDISEVSYVSHIQAGKRF